MSKEIACSQDMTEEECEMVLLKNAIEEMEDKNKQIMITVEIREIVDILKKFIVQKKLICYGGTAINNILPKNEQFYSDFEIPDFDMYSMHPMEDAKALADLYYRSGFTEVQAKAGIHVGTFKVFVNYIPIADLTFLQKQIFENIQKETVILDGIHYAPPNFLRMNMYLELSRPTGDISRWEKVLTRLNLLNKYYPIFPKNNCETKCEKQRTPDEFVDFLFQLLLSFKVVFFGGYAIEMYEKAIFKTNNTLNECNLWDSMRFDVFAEDHIQIANIIVNAFKEKNIVVVQKKNPSIGELIPESIDLFIDTIPIVSLYQPVSCHSYNEMSLSADSAHAQQKADNSHFSNTPFERTNTIRIATIETILNFYLAFYYTNKTANEKQRLLCLATSLFEIEQKNRTVKTGILNRFSLTCYGKQKSLIDIRVEKANKHNEFDKMKKKPKEYDWYFLNYVPTNQPKHQKQQYRKQYSYNKPRKQKRNFTRRKKGNNNNLIQF